MTSKMPFKIGWATRHIAGLHRASIFAIKAVQGQTERNGRMIRSLIADRLAASPSKKRAD